MVGSRVHSSRQLLGVLAAVVAMLGPAAAPAGSPSSGDSGVRDASGGSASAQTEQTIAVDPTHPDNVLIGFISGITVSHDGGLTWRLAGPTCSGDNNPAFDALGSAYFNCDTNGNGFYRSTDAGETWSAAMPTAGPADNNGDLVDRPWLIRGNSGHLLYLSWESFFTNPAGWVFAKSSADGGRTWGVAHRVDAMLTAQQDPRQFPAVGADGTLYVVYVAGMNAFTAPQELPESLIVARSRDGGATWQQVTAAANVTRTSSPEEETETISSLAADPRRAGRLALTWADERSGESRILVTDSVDGGISWSAPADVADDPAGRGNEHDHPQVAFAPNGDPIVVWRDRRCCGGAWQSRYQLFARPLAISSAGKLTGGPTLQLTNGPQQPNSSTMFNEYLGIAAGPEGLSVAWNQPRGGVASTTYRRVPLSGLFTSSLTQPLATWSAPGGTAEPRSGSTPTAGPGGSAKRPEFGPGAVARARPAASRGGQQGAGDAWYGPPLAGLAIALLVAIRVLSWRRRRRSRQSAS